MHDAERLVEQQSYYDARAPEYDDWWLRRGRYDLGDAHHRLWVSEIEQLRAWLHARGPLGRVLELAAGTGNWTKELVGVAESVVAVDGSAETLEINRGKLPAAAAVELVHADVFGYEPPGVFDTVFFSFWLSHVPASRRGDHWSLVRRALRTGGQVVMIDNAHGDRVATSGFGRVHTAGGGGSEIRELADGRRFEIVKHYWHPHELVADARTHGVALDVRETDHHFVFAHGRFVPEEGP